MRPCRPPGKPGAAFLLSGGGPRPSPMAARRFLPISLKERSPMPVLTEKQTAFLRALAQGAVPSEAYRIGFGHARCGPWMRQSAHVLMRAPKLAPFVEAARAGYRRSLAAATEAAAEEHAAKDAALLGELGVSRERILRALAAIAFADPTQFMSWDCEGNVTLRSSAEIGAAAAGGRRGCGEAINFVLTIYHNSTFRLSRLRTERPSCGRSRRRPGR